MNAKAEISSRELSVAVLIDPSLAWGRRLIQGINRYAHANGPWHLYVHARGRNSPTRLPPGWQGDGIIAQLSDRSILQHIQQQKVPVVNVSSVLYSGNPVPTVRSDNTAAAELVVEHFLARGFRNFAYDAHEETAHVWEHRDRFVQSLEQRGLRCHHPPQGLNELELEKLYRGLGGWLRELPKPIAVHTFGAERGLDLIEVCRRESFVVPHEVAVMGGDYDDVFYETSNPPMSGVVLETEQQGYSAAQLLDALIGGEDAPEKRYLVPPTRIMENPSTDTLAVNDRDLVWVMRYLEEHALEPINMGDVLREVPVARRTIDRKFKLAFGRTPAEEIRHRRVSRARMLLVETEMTLAEIAHGCGFCSSSHLSHVFKTEVGVRPSAYRSKSRSG